MYSTAQQCNYLRQLYSQAVKFIEIGFFIRFTEQQP